MAPRARRITTEQLERRLRGEVTIAELAREVGLSRQGMAKRLQSQPIMRRLERLARKAQPAPEGVPEQPAPDTAPPSQGKPSSPVLPVADHHQLEGPEQEEQRGGSHFQYAGKGRARIGFHPRRDGAADLVAAEHAGRVRVSKVSRDGSRRVMLMDPTDPDIERYREMGWLVSA